MYFSLLGVSFCFNVCILFPYRLLVKEYKHCGTAVSKSAGEASRESFGEMQLSGIDDSEDSF